MLRLDIKGQEQRLSKKTFFGAVEVVSTRPLLQKELVLEYPFQVAPSREGLDLIEYLRNAMQCDWKQS
jgi:hypothetical protein